MALDTASKRGSAIHHGCPWRGLFPFPDGTIDQGDRQHAAFLASSILAGAAQLAATLVGPWQNVLEMNLTTNLGAIHRQTYVGAMNVQTEAK